MTTADLGPPLSFSAPPNYLGGCSRGSMKYQVTKNAMMLKTSIAMPARTQKRNQLNPLRVDAAVLVACALFALMLAMVAWWRRINGS